jgi:hypothetical protein
MRTRSTWQGNGAATPRQAATSRTADIYKMNQEHPDASPIDYESGDPDSWAESWHGYGDVEAEYEGGHVKRNELNFAEFRDNTWKHKDSDNWHSGKGTYDNVKDGEGKFENTSGKSTGEKAGRTYEAGTQGGAAPSTTSTIMATDRRDMAERKAKAVERIVRAALRTSNEKLIEDVAIGYMGMPDHVVVATLRALDAVSPDALTQENKMRRALACTKLSARLLGDKATEKQVEVLASTFMTIDDPTLRNILGQLAAARVAQQQDDEQEQDDQQGKTGQQQVTGQVQPVGQQQVQGQVAPVGQQQEQQGQQQDQGQQQQSQQEQAQQRFMQQQQQSQQQQGQQQEQQGQQQQGQQDQEEGQIGIPKMGHGDLPPAELQMLDQMLREEMGQQGVPAGDDLTALFEAAPAPAAPVAPVMAAQGQPGGVQIAFDDDDEVMQAPPSGTAAAQVAAQGDELDTLFGDNDEVVAQRQIKAAEMEQQAREGGFVGVGRTASSKGAKKIGQVQRGKPASVDAVLENIWDRP